MRTTTLHVASPGCDHCIQEAEDVHSARHDNHRARRRGSVRDPVCGMPVDPEHSMSFHYMGGSYYFCSEHCRMKFQDHPEAYLVKEGQASQHRASLPTTLAQCTRR